MDLDIPESIGNCTCNQAVMRSILVLSEDSGILLFAESYLESEDQFDSLGVYQLSSSLFALYKLSFDCGTSEEHSLKWLRKGESLLIFSCTSEPQYIGERGIQGNGLLIIITFDSFYIRNVANAINDRIVTFFAHQHLDATQSLCASGKRILQSNLKVLNNDILSDLFLQLVTVDTSEVFSGIYSRKTLSEVQDDTYILLYHMSNASSSSSSPVLPCSEGSNSMTELSQDERYGEEVVQVERFDGLNPPPVDLLTRDAFAERIEREQITDGINTPPLYLLHNCLYRMLPCCRFFNFNRNFNFADTDTNSTALRTCTAAVHSHSCSNRTQPIHHPINRLLNNQMDSGTGTRDPFKVAEPSVPSRYLVLHLKGSECVVARQSAETPTMGRFFENIIDMSKKSFRKIPKCKDDDRSTSKGGSQGTTEKNEGRHKEEAIASVSSEEKRDEILCRSSARKCKDTMERASSIAGIYNPSRTRTTGSSVDSRKPVKSVPEIIEDVSKLPNQIVDTNNDGAIRQPQLSTQLMTGPQAPSDAQPTSTLKGKIIHADTSPSITSASQQISQSSSPFTSPSISDPPSRGGSRVEGSVVTYQLESMAFLGYVLTVCTPCKTALPPHPLVSTYSPPLEEKINADNSMNLIMTASNRRHSYNSFQNRNRRSESRNHHVIPEKESDTIVGLMSGTNSSAGDEVRAFAEVELPQFCPPSQPPSQLSSQPPSQLPSQPSSQPPSQLPSQPSSQPHSQPPSQLPSQPTSQPHSRSHSRPQSLPHSQPHSQPHSPSTSDDAWKYFFLHGSACL